MFRKEYDYEQGEEQSYVFALMKGIAYHLVSATIRQIEQNFGPHTMLVNSSVDTKDHQFLFDFIEEQLETWRKSIANQDDWIKLKSQYLQPEINNLLKQNDFDNSLIDEKFDSEFKRIIKKSWCKVQVINVDHPNLLILVQRIVKESVL